MEEIKTQAIVLASVDYKDADKRLTLFSLEYGLLYATIKGVKKPKAKLANFAQPFCFAEYILSKKGEYSAVINASSIENFFELTTNFDKYIIGTAMLEFCAKNIKQNDANAQLFVLLLKSLEALDMTEANQMAVLIKFLIEAFGLIGYKLTLDKCACCNKPIDYKYGFNYSFDHNGIICPFCSSKVFNYKMSAVEQGILKNINACDIDSIANLKFADTNALVEIIKLLNKQYFSYFGEELSSIKQYI